MNCLVSGPRLRAGPLPSACHLRRASDTKLDPIQAAHACRDALEQAGNPNSRVEVIPGANHTLAPSKTGCNLEEGQTLEQILKEQGFDPWKSFLNWTQQDLGQHTPLSACLTHSELPDRDRGMAQEPEAITSPYDFLNFGGKMKSMSLTNTMVAEKERPSLTLVSTLQSTTAGVSPVFPSHFHEFVSA